MATAVRVTSSGKPAEPIRLALTGSGEFGDRVADMLASLVPGSRSFAPADLAGAFGSDCAAVVVAASRPSWCLCARADSLASRHARAWLPIVLEHPILRIGPLIRPPDGPCFACYRARRLQHETQYEASAILDAAYDDAGLPGPAGYLPHLARFAAAGAAGFLADAVTGSVAVGGLDTGHVLTFDVLSGQVSLHHVVGCHGCDREWPAIAAAPADLTRIGTAAARSRALIGRSRAVAVPR